MVKADQDERQVWQTKLQDEFSPEIDSSLIAALVYEPGQTFDDIYALLSGLKSEVPDGAYGTDSHVDDGDTETGSSSTAIDMENVQRALDEWKLVDKESIDPDNLRMTDEEDHGTEEDVSEEKREAIRLGTAAGEDKIAIEEVAAEQTDIIDEQWSPTTSTNSSLAFLIHAFPTRTPAYLQEILLDEGENVTRAVDTLMTRELVESGALDEETYAEVKDSHDQKTGFASRMADDDETLYKGTGLKKKTKKDRQRKKAQEAEKHAFDGVSSASRSGTLAMQKVNLTDVRKGAPDRIRLGQRLNGKKENVKAEETDAEMAARIAKEERIAAGLSPETGDDGDDEAESIRDNDWLFSSSVLEQLSLLLDYPSHKVKGVHASCHMNLRATLHRLINTRCQEFTSMDQLDLHNEQPIGTCRIITDNLCTLLPAKPRSEVEKLLYATVGREDAVLDLAQLSERIESTAVGERTDILDPMKHERTSQVQAPTLSQQIGQNKGHFDWVGGDTPLFNAAKSATPYASIAQRGSSEPKSDARQFALQRLREGASAVTFPLNSAQASGQIGDTFVEPESSGPSSQRAETASEARRLAQEYTAISQDYRIRRQEALAKAARSYRSTHNTAISKGPMRGAAAWVYAEEARRLDAKARAFALQASQATVRARMLSNRSTNLYSSPLQSSGEDGGDLVDLHGLTVHDSLTITRQALDAWYPKTVSSSRSAPLHIVTGVGRHSKGQVALIRPAVLAMLQRERWNTREPQQGHILVLGKSR
ncbi:uncharacterized protein FA14DRAFT_160956 [Meira miltonrushii]|uniref:Smr domain-containing protein n=1 Tax=Meira miltonrushii TaxID=1280837 RepID=A0A316VIB2_9BASI|nr:uncharacterized protein FA14DRAFT_160956 [Meira miltonrushii]PWN36063.1 hypothetical protein FA14DRAFT_160956 [Meira miltonrushii]